MCPFHVEKPEGTEGIPAELFNDFESKSEARRWLHLGGDPGEDEHHAIFDCASYSYARSLFPDLFCGGVSKCGALFQPAEL